jgi:protein SMG9
MRSLEYVLLQRKTNLNQRKGKMEDVFPVQSTDSIIDARHETNGMDIYVVPEERLILIDTQPLFSASILMTLIQRGDHYSNISSVTQNKLSADVLSIENHIDLLAVQMGLLLFSICHVVLITMDDGIGDGSGSDADGTVTLYGDVKMLRFVQTMRMLQKGVPNSLTGREEGGEYVPDVVFLYNRVSSRTIQSEFCVKQMGRFLDAYMTNTSIRKNGAIYPTMGCALAESCNRVNFFFLPDKSDAHLYAMLTRTLRNALLNMPRTGFARTVSERDWLQSAARIWELIRKSPFISEYNRSYQKLALYKIP